MIRNLLSIFVLILIILIVVVLLCNKQIFSNFGNMSNISNVSNVSNVSNFRNLPTIEEQQIENDEFLVAYDKFKKSQQEQEKNEVPYNWNLNNTLESMKREPCLAENENGGRLSCFTAPAWWYPEKAYKQDNFKSVYYGDYYNPIYNYLGNSQEMYWDFRSIKDPIINNDNL